MKSTIVAGISLSVLFVILFIITILLSSKVTYSIVVTLYMICGLLLIGLIILFSITSSTNNSNEPYNLLEHFQVGKKSYMTRGNKWTISNKSLPLTYGTI
jgi:hypothetical protein